MGCIGDLRSKCLPLTEERFDLVRHPSSPKIQQCQVRKPSFLYYLYIYRLASLHQSNIKAGSLNEVAMLVNGGWYSKNQCSRLRAWLISVSACDVMIIIGDLGQILGHLRRQQAEALDCWGDCSLLRQGSDCGAPH
jgi:hypothetical protein